MTAEVPDALRAEITETLRRAGASFAFLHGSRVAGTHRATSDVDVAAWWQTGVPQSFACFGRSRTISRSCAVRRRLMSGDAVTEWTSSAG
jgi:predicted nucleotidyltransferase